MIIRIRACAAVCAVMLTAFGACSPSEPSSPGANPATSGPAAEPAAATPPSVTVETVGFDDAYRYPDGIEVTLTAIAHGELAPFPATEDPDAKEGDPYTVVSASVRNGTAEKFELLVGATLRYGKDRTVAYRLGLDDSNGKRILAPGEDSNPYDMGFLVPVADRDDVVLELQIDNGQHPPVVFAGSIAQERA